MFRGPRTNCSATFGVLVDLVKLALGKGPKTLFPSLCTTPTKEFRVTLRTPARATAPRRRSGPCVCERRTALRARLPYAGPPTKTPTRPQAAARRAWQVIGEGRDLCAQLVVGHALHQLLAQAHPRPSPLPPYRKRHASLPVGVTSRKSKNGVWCGCACGGSALARCILFAHA